jgi:hypothetical protein
MSNINRERLLQLAIHSGNDINEENEENFICFAMLIKADMFNVMHKSCFSDLVEFTSELKKFDQIMKTMQ